MEPQEALNADSVVTRLVIPLFPFRPQGVPHPTRTRIRPHDALHLENMIENLKPDIIHTRFIADHPWSVFPAFSPYSPDCHAMIMETSPHRYLPALNVSSEEGAGVVRMSAEVIAFLIARLESGNGGTVLWGYNWSPRSWGSEEEKTGFQSIPTKWHGMIWTWPSRDTRGEGGWGGASGQWEEVPLCHLPPGVQGILGHNDHWMPVGNALKRALESDGFVHRALTPFTVGRLGLRAQLRLPLLSLMREDNGRAFFDDLLSPLGRILDATFRTWTEAFTTMNCTSMDKILAQTSSGKGLTPEQLAYIRQTPKRRNHSESRGRLGDDTLFEALDPLVTARCNEQELIAWWRKGFGYGLVISQPVAPDEGLGELRILIGTSIGPGGPVEAMGVALRRPEDCFASERETVRRSHLCWELGAVLEDASERLMGGEGGEGRVHANQSK